MKGSVYRNFFYLKESISEFYHSNRKRLIFSVIAVIVGISLGLCLGLSNLSNFTFINCTDKTVVVIFSGGDLGNFFLNNILKYSFIFVLILFINNFPFLTLLNYLLFGYLSFCLALNSVIISSLLNFKGILYTLLCYFPLNLLIIFLLITLFLVCKTSGDCYSGNNKFSGYPVRAILLIYFLILISTILLSCITKIFTNFIVIIV